ncbi:uncharacterized protein LOC113370012, partial [Ctenocephalides felis]|uniref:uncharacterized protein LOC113370012 n=1 Tax=Ctenocephalides felis TaxID=7515 RepID=UPI000E6E44E3
MPPQHSDVSASTIGSQQFPNHHISMSISNEKYISMITNEFNKNQMLARDVKSVAEATSSFYSPEKSYEALASGASILSDLIENRINLPGDASSYLPNVGTADITDTLQTRNSRSASIFSRAMSYASCRYQENQDYNSPITSYNSSNLYDARTDKGAYNNHYTVTSSHMLSPPGYPSLDPSTLGRSVMGYSGQGLHEWLN